jgi:hypothetical protein
VVTVNSIGQFPAPHESDVSIYVLAHYVAVSVGNVERLVTPDEARALAVELATAADVAEAHTFVS